MKRDVYYYIWVEGLNPDTGEKIKWLGPEKEAFETSAFNDTDVRPKVRYTTNKTEAMRVHEENIPEIRKTLRDEFGILVTDADFIPTSYAPSGTIMNWDKFKRI